MKKNKFFVLIGILAILTVVLSACSLLGKSNETSAKKKVEFTKAMIVRNPTEDGGVFVYSGNPIEYPESSFTFEVNGNYPSTSDFTYTYENNVNAGDKTAKLTIKAKDSNPYVKGSVVLYFTIIPGQADVTDKASLNAYLADVNYDAVRLVTSLTIDEGETITIPQGNTLRLTGNVVLTNYGTLNVAGAFTVDGATYYNGGSANGYFKNYGTVENSGAITVTSKGEILNKGTFRSTGTISNAGIIYTDESGLPTLTQKDSGVQYVRTQLLSSNISMPNLKENGEEFSQAKGNVTPTVILEKNAAHTVAYSDNDHVGTATVTVTVDEKNIFFYGSASVQFTIIPGVATVSSYAELAAAKNSGNYDRYEITDNIVVPENETLTFDTTDKVNFAKTESKLTIGGTFINNGVITCSKPHTNSYTGETTTNQYSLLITVNEGGTYRGTGKLASEKISVSAAGDFTFSAPEKVTFVTFQQTKGVLTVQGEVALEPSSPGKATTLSIGSAATLIIEQTGSVLTPNLTSSSTITNAGTLTVTNQLYLYTAAQVENTGTINLGAETIVYDMKWANEGTIINNGEFVCNNVTSFVNTENGFDNENGYVWTYDAFPHVDENVTLKKKLSVDNVLLEYTETPYTAERKVPTFTVDGEEVTKSDFVLYVMNYKDEIVFTTNSKHNKYNSSYPRDVGTYTLSIRTNNSKCPYGGTLDLPYTITKGTCHLTKPSSFSSVIENTNYEKIYLETDVSMGNDWYLSTYNLAEGITLDTNGYSLTFTYANFYVYGTLILSAPTESTNDYSILIKGTANLRNHNAIINNGVLCIDSGSERYLTGSSDVTLENNGDIYAGPILTFPAEKVTSGSGNIYNRQTLTASDLALEYAETVYDTTDKEPTVSYTGSLISSAEYDLFAITYANNHNAGNATATVKPNVLSQTYYGKAELPFTINKASKLVTSLSSEVFSDSVNYFEVKLLNDITLSEDVLVPVDMNLNLSSYTLDINSNARLIFDSENVGSNKIRRGMLVAEGDTASTFTKNLNNVEKIIVTGDISDRIEIASFTGAFVDTTMYNKVKVQRHYNSSDGTYFEPYAIQEVTVDLCGYDLTGGITLVDNNRDFTLVFENSLYMTTNSTIGTATADEYGFYQNWTSKKIEIVFNHLTIAGIQMDGGNGNTATITGNDCIIERNNLQEKKSYALYINAERCADSSFNNCTFNVANTVTTKAHFTSGKHSFTDCNLTVSDMTFGTTQTSSVHINNSQVH